MQSDALQYLNFIEIEERRQARMIRRMGGASFGSLFAGVWMIREGFDAVVIGAVFASFITVFMMISRAEGIKAHQREEALLRLLEVHPDYFEDGPARERLVLAAETGAFNELQVKKNTGAIRGHDEKGFTGGKKANPLDAAARRRDAMESESDYVGLEGDLRRSEHLVEEANARYEEAASQHWKAAEEADLDLIEAGVERLGDLVQTDWFEKNAKDGAVDEAMGQGQKE
jgi:hypothetical protein